MTGRNAIKYPRGHAKIRRLFGSKQTKNKFYCQVNFMLML